MQLDVFGQSLDTDHHPPLAAKLRPKSLMDFYGQQKIRPQLEKLSTNPRHVIFWGPPGTGKTTLAYIIAGQIGRELTVFNAVTSGIPELKRVIQEMLDRRREFGKESILFIDEIHDSVHNFKSTYLPNVFRWKDRVKKIFVASATHNVSSLAAIQLLGKITENRISIFGLFVC